MRSGGADCAEQPRQTSTRIRIERRNSITRNRLYIESKQDYLIQSRPEGLVMRVLRAFYRNEASADQALRESCSAGSREFMEPERNPSRSRVTNLKPRALKMRVNSAAMSKLRARGSSLRSISMRTISPW